jgi:protein-S-isoprenylcysteine O-methyltransferase Ste14
VGKISEMASGLLQKARGVADPLHAVFNNYWVRKVCVRLRLPIVAGICAALIFFRLIHADMLLIAIGVCLMGELLQLWCFASLNKQKVLALRGPYALVRNPMYIGRYFIILGGVLLLKEPAAVVVFTILYYFYMVNRVKREEAALEIIFGEAYRTYCRNTDRFLPSFRNNNMHALWFWDWDLLRKNNGYLNFAGLMVCCGILWYSAL